MQQNFFFRSYKSVLAAACSATPNALPTASSPSNYNVMLMISVISYSFFCNYTNVVGHMHNKCKENLFIRNYTAALATTCTPTPKALPTASSPSNSIAMLMFSAISCSFFCNCTNVAGHRTWKMIRKLLFRNYKAALALLLLAHFLQHPPLLIITQHSCFLQFLFLFSAIVC